MCAYRYHITPKQLSCRSPCRSVKLQNRMNVIRSTIDPMVVGWPLWHAAASKALSRFCAGWTTLRLSSVARRTALQAIP
jgi:hypothetical protein